jgi:hypothetical protein
MARRIRDADRRSADIGTSDVSNRRTGGSARAGSDDDDDEVQVMDADVRAAEDDYDYDDDDDDDDDGDNDVANVNAPPAVVTRGPTSLQTMFAPPTHLMHLGGGFQGARNFAKDARRWLLCNIQSDDDFACHALNRDVWGDDLVENLVREGFVLWQAVSIFCATVLELPRILSHRSLRLSDDHISRWSDLHYPVQGHWLPSSCYNRSPDRESLVEKRGLDTGQSPHGRTVC